MGICLEMPKNWIEFSLDANARRCRHDIAPLKVDCFMLHYLDARRDRLLTNSRYTQTSGAELHSKVDSLHADLCRAIDDRGNPCRRTFGGDVESRSGMLRFELFG